MWALTVSNRAHPPAVPSAFQVSVNRADFGLPLAEAVAAPRFHHQWPPTQPDTDPISVERGHEPEAAVAAALAALG